MAAADRPAFQFPTCSRVSITCLPRTRADTTSRKRLRSISEAGRAGAASAASVGGHSASPSISLVSCDLGFINQPNAVIVSSAGFLLPGATEMRTFTIAAIIASLTMPAFAQGAGKGAAKPGAKTEQEIAEEKKQQKLDEKAHKDSLSRIPDRDQKTDPWGKIR